MAATNNIIVEFEDSVVARYRKVTTGAISGIRLNPAKDNERIPFVLQSTLSNFNTETGELTFSYDTDVIELYSEQEAKVFKRLNPYLFTNALIEVYSENKPKVIDNTTSDRDIIKIANLKDAARFKTALEKVTSPATVLRIKETVDALDRPKSFLAMAESHYATISNT